MKNLLKGTCLVVALMATFAMVGCGGGGGGKKSTAPVNSNVAVNIPLPAPAAANMRANVRASFNKDTFRAFYYNDKEEVKPYDYKFDDASATVIFAMVPAIDMIVKSELDKGDGNGFKPYYQGLISKAAINGYDVKQKLTPESTAKAMLFAAKVADKKYTNLSVEDFEYTMEQEKAKGNDVWDILGVTSADMEKSLTDLTVENVESKAKTAADSLEIEEKPAPQPTPSSFASREALEKATWRAADESVVKPLVTSSASKAAKVLYTYNGEKWETPTEAYFVEAVISPDLNLHYFAFGLVDSKYTGMGQIFPFVEDNNTYFSYEIHLKENKTSSGYCSFETAEVDGITYLKGTDKEKDANGNKKVFYMASVAIPQGLVTAIEQMKNPTPTTGYVDELNKKLAENTTWKTSDERTIYQLLTTGREFPGQIYDDEIGDWVDVDPIADGGMAAEIIYSTKDGANWTAPTDKPIIIYDEMGGSHPYCLYKNNQWVGPNQQFHYKKAKNLFRYIQYSNNSVEEPVEEGLEYREVLFSGYYKIEEITSEGVTYYRATNTDNGAKDVYFFKLIKRPEDLGVNPDDEEDGDEILGRIINANWVEATKAEIQNLIGYENERAAKVAYGFNGTKWETPTNVFLTYAEIPTERQPWQIYVNGQRANSTVSIVESNNVWTINNLLIGDKIIAGSYKLLTAEIDGVKYIKMKNTESEDVLTSIFMEVGSLPSNIKSDIAQRIEDLSAYANIRK